MAERAEQEIRPKLNEMEGVERQMLNCSEVDRESITVDSRNSERGPWSRCWDIRSRRKELTCEE